MDIISNSFYDVRSKYGRLILVCLDSDEQKIQKLKLELSQAGYAYVLFPISGDTISQRDYLTDVIKALDTCSCFVPIITDSLFDDDHTIYRNIFWFTVGYIQTKCEGGIIPFLAEGDGHQLASTPLKNANLVSSPEEVIKTIESKYANRLMKSQYYDNYLLNYYAYNRIIYRRISIRCRIYESDFRRVCEAMEYEWGSSADKKLDRFLTSNLMCAYKVLSFGCDNAVPPQFEPYKDEIHPSENGLASSTICKSSYTILDYEEQEKTGIHAELEIDAIVPVHKLFGVYFKCYITLKEKDYFWIVPNLFAHDLGEISPETSPTDDQLEDPSYWRGVFPKGVHPDFSKCRLYFSLGYDECINREKTIILTPEMGVGETADYLFPQ